MKIFKSFSSYNNECFIASAQPDANSLLGKLFKDSVSDNTKIG